MSTDLKTEVGTYPPLQKFLLFTSLCFLLFLSCISYSLPNAFLPVFNEHHNVSTSMTGAALGAGPFGLIIASLFAPYLMNRFQSRWLLAAGSAGLGAAFMVYSALDHITDSGTWYELLSVLGRAIGGTFGGVLEVVCYAALIAIYPDHVATAASIGEATLNGALAFSPFFGSVLYAADGFKTAFIVPGVIVACATIPAAFAPQLSSNEKKKEGEKRSLRVLLDPWLLFPLWHLASAQILMSYHMPLLAIYVEHAFGKDVVWAGTVLLVNTMFICVSSPVWGWLMDKYNPYIILQASCVFLPLSYLFVGPAPFLGIAASEVQLMVALSFLGVAVPMGCISALPVMYDVYPARHGGELPSWIANTLVSLYCASYPLGIFIGSTISGFIAPYLDFGWSTGGLGLVYIAQSTACLFYVWRVQLMKAKKISRRDVVFENKEAEAAAGGKEGGNVGIRGEEGDVETGVGQGDVVLRNCDAHDEETNGLNMDEVKI